VSVGVTLGEAVGDSVGTTVGLGVVGDGVYVTGMPVGTLVGLCVGTQCNKGSRRRFISSNTVRRRRDSKSLHI